MTHRVEQGVDVNVPVATAYHEWMQFEGLPRFLRHVESVRQLDERLLRWRVYFGGKVREFVAEIVEQVPDKRIAWRSIVGGHSGMVTFHRLHDRKCHVILHLEYDPKGFLGNGERLVGARGTDVERDMARFVEFVEKRHVATGTWRGPIQDQEAGHATDGLA